MVLLHLYKLFTFLSVVGLGLSCAFANQIDSFLVEIEPQSIVTNEASTITITAIGEDGAIITDYEGSVLILPEPSEGVTIPQKGLVEFMVSDAGVISFPNSLEFNVPGTYEINVESLINYEIAGTTFIDVADPNSELPAEIQIDEPVNDVIITQTPLTVRGSTNFFQTPVFLNLNGERIDTTDSDDGGLFSFTVDELTEGSNTIEVTIEDFDQNITATDTVTIDFVAPNLVKNLAYDPGEKIRVNELLTVTLETEPTVSEASLIIDNTEYSMSKDSLDTFSTALSFENEGFYNVGLDFITAQGNESFRNIDTIEVEPLPTRYLSHLFDPSNQINVDDEYTLSIFTNPQVSDVQVRLNDMSYAATLVNEGEFTLTRTAENPGVYNVGLDLTTPDGIVSNDDIDILRISEAIMESAPLLIAPVTTNRDVDTANIDVIRDAVDDVDIYDVSYSTDRNNLNNVASTAATSFMLDETDPNNNYYFQIRGFDESGSLIAESEVVVAVRIEANNIQDSCTVQGIQINPKIVDGQHYLVRSSVPTATTYTIYNSKSPVESIESMDIIGTTQETRFPYTYNDMATSEITEYFAVTATCESGSEILVDGIKDVVVGPEHTVMLIALLCLMIALAYTGRRRL